ncbi:MAG: hypothetical protein IH948_00740 [Bacteroidetes bacterium]|nr:hypothetical protein [Bacteroidota bacterium]
MKIKLFCKKHNCELKINIESSSLQGPGGYVSTVNTDEYTCKECKKFKENPIIILKAFY